MNISRFAKAVAYEALTALLLLVSVVFQAAMHREGGLEKAYSHSCLLLFATAALLLGIGVYSLMAYTRRHRQHILESVFFLAVGLALMIAVVAEIVLYGGLEGAFTESGYTAANLNIVLLAGLPVPFLIRSIILAFSTREALLGRRLGVQIGAAVLTAAMLVLFAAGKNLHLLQYTGPGDSLDSGESMPGYEPDGDEP